MKGTVHHSQGGVYLVRLESGMTVEASLRGRLKQEARTGDRVVIGDHVEVTLGPSGAATIDAVDPRRSQIVRRGPAGRRPKVVAANVDRLLVVGAVGRPELRQVLLDRLLAVGEANGVEPGVVLNKVDLIRETGGWRRQEDDVVTPEARSTYSHLTGLYRRIGYKVFETSAVSGEGLDALARVLCEGTSALVGPSGVGKSSLLNAIEPGLELRTGELSHKVGRGRQTTVSARLITLACGGKVADTPGFSDVGLCGVDPQDLEGCFPEFDSAREKCQFRGCSHLHEPNCGVQAALARNEIDPARFASYRSLAEEARTRSR